MDQIAEQNRLQKLRNSVVIGTKRQVIVAGRVGATYSDFIEAGSGLAATLKASASDPFVATLANGFQRAGAVTGAALDHILFRDTDLAFSSLTANATNFLGIERAPGNVTTAVKTQIPPFYGAVRTSDRENKIAASFAGTNGDTLFTDLYGNTFRCIGGATISSGNQFFGNNTLRVAGAGQYAVLDTPPNTTNLDAWTLEFNYRFDAGGTTEVLLYAGSDNHIALIKDAAQSLLLYLGNGSAWNIVNGQAIYTLAAATTYHLALVFENSNSFKFYVDGVLRYIGATSVFLQVPFFNKLIIGANNNFSSPSTANFGNLGFWPYSKYSNKTLTTGTTVFTAPSAAITADTAKPFRYAVPDSVMLATFDDATFDDKTFFTDSYGRYITLSQDAGAGKAAYIKNDAVNSKWGGRVLRLDGGNYCFAQVNGIAPAHKWTWRSWVKHDNFTNAEQYLFGNDDFYIGLSFTQTSGRIKLWLSSNGTSWDIANAVLSSTTTFAVNTYYHVELTYDGTTYRLFVDGVLEISVTSQLSLNWPGEFLFGATLTGSQFITGYIQDLQFLPYALHVTGFTPPTASPTPSDIYAYDIPNAKMYKGLPPTTFAAQPTIFVGEAETGASLIEKIVAYALNGKCGPIEYTGFANEDFTNSTNIRHNIGIKDVNIKTSLKFITPYQGYAAGETIDRIISYDNVGNRYSLTQAALNRNLISHVVGAAGEYLFFSKFSGQGAGISVTPAATYGMLIFNIERSW